MKIIKYLQIEKTVTEEATSSLLSNDTQDFGRSSKVFCQYPYSLQGRPLQVRNIAPMLFA